MVQPFVINGSAVVIPGVYDTLRVADSLPAPAPAGRSMLVVGEAEEGVPGSLLDLKLNYFTDYPSVKDFYKSGPIVDAARMAFTRQPANIFGGQIQRLYVYKTNASTRASKSISSPANFGSIVASRYGEPGNFIKSQIKDAVTEVKPSKTFLYLPSPGAQAVSVSVSGVVSAISLLAAAGADALVTALGLVSGLSASGGAAEVSTTGAAMVADVSASGDVLTITRTSGGTFSVIAGISAGDVVYIPFGGTFAGTADANAGVYTVVSWSSTVISLRQLKHTNATATIAPVAFATGVGVVSAGVAADLKVWSPIVLSVSASTAVGAGASLELAGASAALFAVGDVMRAVDLVDMIDINSAATGSVVATAPAASRLSISLSNAVWATTPVAGDLVRIPRGSILAGAGSANVGSFVVKSASSQSLVLDSCYGLSTVPVSLVSFSGSMDDLQWAPGFVGSVDGARRLNSVSERQVFVDAVRSTDNLQFPTSPIGGSVALEIGYFNAAATAAVVSIDFNRVMTITPTGGSLTPVVVRLGKYASLQALVDFLNTQANISARVPDPLFKSLPTSALDEVTSVGILSTNAVSAFNGRIKKDYYAWVQFFLNNTSMLAFLAGAMALKAGLPTAEAVAGFLSGAALGGSANLDVQNALDAGLKIDVRFVNTLFSRDATYDVSDEITDTSSSYSIDSINAAVKAHVATAGGLKVKRERMGMTAFHGSFADAKVKVADISYEGCQMAFQMVRATDSDGNLTWMGPHMLSVAVAAGRAQAPLGTSMLRKPFAVNAVKHIGNLSYFDDTLAVDFDVEDDDMLEEAIVSGLMTFRSVPGFGVRMESPDLSTRSRVNDPQGWYWERVNVSFVMMEVRQTLRSTLDNFIGARTSDVSVGVVQTALINVLNSYVKIGALKRFSIDQLTNLGNGYQLKASVFPTEALEFIEVDLTVQRDLSTAA